MSNSYADLFAALGLDPLPYGALTVRSPVDGAILANLATTDLAHLDTAVDQARQGFEEWRRVPMPVRGQLIAALAQVMREAKQPLAHLISLECGKIRSEALGEVQEIIDIANYAVGLSRSLGGLVLPSELPDHILQERWHPKGVVGIITAFNFPAAVWAWNFCISAICGNTHLWKPSEKTPLTALACQNLLRRAKDLFTQNTGINLPKGLNTVLVGGRDLGQAMVAHTGITMISATGSCAMGQAIQTTVAKDLGRSCLLELGGNNAVIITPSAPLELALQSTLFGAMGTTGQRCTTTRRLFVHRSIAQKVLSALEGAYRGLRAPQIGAPWQDGVLIGPLIDGASFESMQHALAAAKAQGGQIVGGERVHTNQFGPDAFYVRPALALMPEQTAIVFEETFAPILYVMVYQDLADAVAMNNQAAQGLSAAIFTTDLREAEYFLAWCDTGIANVNNGTSGAEIGGAFGGNKATGNGRESGSDSWKQYMNRQTARINTNPTTMILAQGVEFPFEINIQ